MNEVTTQEPLNTFGLGAHEHWDRNTAKAKRDGLESCSHCGKGMIEGTGYTAIWKYFDEDNFYPLSMKEQVLASGHAQIVRLGTTCVKNFTTKDKFDIYFQKAGE